MGRRHLDYLEGKNVFACGTCQVHLTTYNELISKVKLQIFQFYFF